MRVLVDTVIWSLALRRRTRMELPATRELASLINDGRVAMIGPVRQEILSGIKDRGHFDQLRKHLRAFPDLPLAAQDYEEAASFFNACREKGIQGSNTDFLICAIAARNKLAIFTTDVDFRHFGRVLPIVLHEARA